MKTTICTLQSPFTLDMYQTFTTDSIEEQILENQIDQGLSDEYDDYDWTYDMNAIHAKLADLWCEFVRDNIASYGIIKNATVLSIHSPKYYNYTTDRADIEIDFDARELNHFIKEKQPEYLKFCEQSSHFSSTPLQDYEEKINFYMDHVAMQDKLDDDWIMYAYEYVNETMYHAITITPATPRV